MDEPRYAKWLAELERAVEAVCREIREDGWLAACDASEVERRAWEALREKWSGEVDR